MAPQKELDWAEAVGPSESPGKLVETQIADPTPQSFQISRSGWYLIIRISDRFPGAASAEWGGAGVSIF